MERIQDIAQQFIAKMALQLDDENFESFINGCSEDFTYVVSTYSPELDRDMIWLEHDLTGFKSLVQMLPEHVRLKGSMSRHITVCEVDQLYDKQARVTSRLLAVHTDISGASQLFATGRYFDTVQFSEEMAPSLLAREVRLETRNLGPGLHVPL